MPGSAEKMLDLLEQRKLLPQFMIDGLRRQIVAAPDQYNCHHVARLLQRKGKITAFQARELLAEITGRPMEQDSSALPTSSDARRQEGDSPIALDEEDDGASSLSLLEEEEAAADDELGLAEDDDEPLGKGERLEKIAESAAEPTEEDDAVVEDAGSDLTTVGDPPTPPPAPNDLSDLLSDPLTSSLLPGADPLAPPPVQKRSWFSGRGPTYTKQGQGDWGSPLLILGGGGLLLLVGLGVFLAFTIKLESGDELFKEAEQDYYDGAYRSSIAKYEEFIQTHSDHPKTSLARVRIALARIRQASSQNDWLQALVTAQNVLPGIETEEALDEVRVELGGMIPDIVAGVAQETADAPDTVQTKQTLDLFKQAMELANNPIYLPGELRAAQTPRLKAAQEQVEAIVRKIERDAKLADGIKSIRAAASRGDFASAYEQHQQLIRLYPRLAHDPKLQAVVRSISGRLADHVTVVEEAIQALPDEPSSSLIAEIALASRNGERINGVDDAVTAFLIDGAAYGLAAADGRLLWRRFVGLESERLQRVGGDTGDVIVADTRDWELVRLRASDGRALWRLPIGEPFDFRLDEERIYVSVFSGRLLIADTAEGNCARQVQFPQRLAQAPAVDRANQLLVQLGDHSNAFVLETATLECRDVRYLGHKTGTIHAQPVVVAGVLLVAHNVGLSRSQLHFEFLTARNENGAAETSPAPIAMRGQITSDLLTHGRRVIVVNDKGSVRLYELDLTDSAAPLHFIGETTGSVEEDAVWPILAGDLLVLADRRLTAFQLPATDGAPSPAWVKHQGELFVAPPVRIGPMLFHARRSPQAAGVTIAATYYDAPNGARSGEPVWQTVIASQTPSAGTVASDDGKTITAFTSTAEIFAIPVSDVGRRVINTAAARFESPADIEQRIELPGGPSVLIDRRTPQRFIIEDVNAKPRMTATRLVGPSRSPAQPTAWRNGLLIPHEDGQISYWRRASDGMQLHPFQAKLIIGKTTEWKRPLALDEERLVFVTSDGTTYLAGVDETGAPHLAATAKTNVPGKIIGQPATLSGRALLVSSDEASDRLWIIDSKLFDASDSVKLPGRLRWGPHVAGAVALLSAQPGGLCAYDSEGALVWQADIGNHLPIAQPIIHNERIILATTAGAIWSLDPESGEATRLADVRQTLSGGPISVAGRIVLRSYDGSVLIIDPDDAQ